MLVLQAARLKSQTKAVIKMTKVTIKSSKLLLPLFECLVEPGFQFRDESKVSSFHSFLPLIRTIADYMYFKCKEIKQVWMHEIRTHKDFIRLRTFISLLKYP
jgi:hypothetical protein